MQSADPSAAQSIEKRAVTARLPWIVLLACFAIFAGRWIWIAGMADYGWNYELGMRIRSGEVPYRDYISALPQLTSYTIVPLLAVLDGNVWAHNIHLYLWWLASLVVGLCVLRKLSGSIILQSAGVFAAACFSFPAATLGHAYSFAGTFFFGLTVLQLLTYQALAKPGALFWAGCFAGLGIFAKQNMGIMAILCGLLSIFPFVKLRQELPAKMNQVGIFLAGVGVMFVPIFSYFALHAGAMETFFQMFRDASAGKGGLLGIIVHVMPFLFFTLETPHRYVWTVVFGIVTTGGFLLWLWPRFSNRTGSAAADKETDRKPDPWLCAAILAVVIVSCASLANLPVLKNAFDGLVVRYIYTNQSYSGVLLSIIYSGLIALSVLCLWHCWRQRDARLWLPTIALPLVVCGQEMSSQIYLPYAAPVGIPLALFLLNEYRVLRNVPRLGCLVAASVVLVFTAFPPDFWVPHFERVYRLPEHSRFSGLHSNEACASYVNALLKNVAPRIHNRTTLWLCFDGPHQAYGGKAVYSVPLLHLDTYNTRSEPILKQRWEKKPPEFVVLGPEVRLPPDAAFLKWTNINAWLSASYDKVWESAEWRVSLWQHKTSRDKLANQLITQ
jgi:hypothetical protein